MDGIVYPGCMSFQIEGSSGDFTTAESLDIARLAARTFVEDGNETASIFPPDCRLVISQARRNEWGEIAFYESTLTRHYA